MRVVIVYGYAMMDNLNQLLSMITFHVMKRELLHLVKVQDQSYGYFCLKKHMRKFTDLMIE